MSFKIDKDSEINNNVPHNGKHNPSINMLSANYLAVLTIAPGDRATPQVSRMIRAIRRISSMWCCVR